jgi:hypothetical protein
MKRQDVPETDVATPSEGAKGKVVSLEQVRADRQKREQDAAAAEADRQKRLFHLEQELRLKVMQYVLGTGRMLFSDFADLIRLGVITDDEDHLPCEIHERNTNHYTWESAEYGEDADDPDDDLLTGLLDQLSAAGLTEDQAEYRQFTESRERQVPAANKVVCPLLSYGENDSPPCAHALNNRFFTRYEEGEHRRYQILPDPKDPVVQSNLHPCSFLGKEMFRLVLPGVWKHDEKPAPSK